VRSFGSEIAGGADVDRRSGGGPAAAAGRPQIPAGHRRHLQYAGQAAVWDPVPGCRLRSQADAPPGARGRGAPDGPLGPAQHRAVLQGAARRLSDRTAAGPPLSARRRRSIRGAPHSDSAGDSRPGPAAVPAPAGMEAGRGRPVRSRKLSKVWLSPSRTAVRATQLSRFAARVTSSAVSRTSPGRPSTTELVPA